MVKGQQSITVLVLGSSSAINKHAACEVCALQSSSCGEQHSDSL